MSKRMISWDNFQQRMFSRVDGTSLGIFRMVFGAVVFYQALFIFDSAFLQQWILIPPFNFHHALFDFLHITPIPDSWVRYLLTIMRVSALYVFLGLFYRLSVLLFLLSFSYLFFLEMGIYNNHYYLIVLIAFLLLISGSNRVLCLDRVLFPSRKAPTIPYWQIFLLKFQVCIVYFFGAISKINGDWLLRAEPLYTDLVFFLDLPRWIDKVVLAYGLSWGGMLVDFIIPFLLFSKRFKVSGFLIILIFNALNHLLFKESIGVFPFLMIGSFILFIEPDVVRQWMDGVRKSLRFPSKVAPLDVQASENVRPIRKRLIFLFLVAYMMFQIFFPLRHWLYPSRASWSNVASDFSWRMKLNSNYGFVRFDIFDPVQNVSFSATLPPSVPSVHSLIGESPRMMMRYVLFIKERVLAQGINNPVITIKGKVMLNHKPPVELYHPDVNFASVDSTLKLPAHALLPFKDLRKMKELDEKGQLKNGEYLTVDEQTGKTTLYRYLNGRKHGWAEVYDERQNVLSKVFYVNGHQEGDWIVYNADGKEHKSILYRKGRMMKSY